MATVIKPSPLLSLPAELRQIIYEELLIIRQPNPRLYHDKNGRDPNFNIDTAILRVNRQIYTESVWILYERNVFHIDLSASISWSSYRRPHAVAQASLIEQPIDHGSRSVKLGMIYPHCLRRMRHIKVVLADQNLRVSAGIQPYRLFSIGDLAVSILRVLSADEGDDCTLQSVYMESGKEAVGQSEEIAERNNDKQVTKILEFRMLRLHRHQYGDGSFNLQILELLGAVEKKRKLIRTFRSYVPMLAEDAVNL